jgi:hypothetical protein
MSQVIIAGDTSGTITLQAPAVSGSSVLTLPATTATLATLTTPSFASTIGVGGATASASGAGITFPATQSASSDANTLDDYEEGTWSPTVTSSGGSITAYTASGTYTKIGRVVYLTATINITTVGTASGTMTITTNPFTPAVVAESRWRNDNTGAHGDTLVENTAFYVLAPTWANNRWYANIVYQTS